MFSASQALRPSRAFNPTPLPSRGGLSRSATFAAVSRLASARGTPLQPLSYFSGVEQAVVGASQPLALPATGRVQAGPYDGLHLNRQEELAFRGPRPLERYQLFFIHLSNKKK